MAQTAGQTYYKGGTSGEIDAQMKPLNDLISSGQYRDIPKGLVGDYFSGKKSLEESIAAIKGTPLYDASKGPQIDVGNGPQRFDPTSKGSGYNPSGQGFYTPQILQNNIDAIRQ